MTEPTAVADPAPLTRRWGSVAGIAGAVVVVALSWALLEASPGRLSDAERTVFSAANAAPDAIATALWPIMQLGTFWVIPVVAMVAWLVWNRPAPALTAALAGLAAWAAAKLGKVVVDRGRPSAFVDATVREAGLSDFGFPSGHAAVAFALATALAPWLGPRWRYVGYALASVVAVARLVVGAHLPLDVVAGAAIGVGVGLAARLVVGVPDARS